MSEPRDYGVAKERWCQYFRWYQLEEKIEQGHCTEAELEEYEQLDQRLEIPSTHLSIALAHELLGCLDAMPAWLYQEMCEHENNPAEATTYHAAAVEFLTGMIINVESRSTWVRLLYPVFVKDIEVKHLLCTHERFEAWLASMTSTEDCQNAMRHWPPRS